MTLWVWRRSDGLNGDFDSATDALDSLVARNDPTLIVFMDAHQDWKDESWARKILMNSCCSYKKAVRWCSSVTGL